MSASPAHPALEQLISISRALGDLRDRVVFIGGAVSPLLQVAPPFPAPRPTADVDAVIATSSYVEAQRIERRLLARRFRRDPGVKAHAHRWIAPSGIPFDLVPTGKHLGGTGSKWDQLAVDTAVRATLAANLVIRHASAPAFLALKWAAFDDRGRNDPLHSDDLEDILALLASRSSLVKEISSAPEALKGYLREQSAEFLKHPFADDLLAAHLNNAQNAAHTIATVRGLLARIAAP